MAAAGKAPGHGSGTVTADSQKNVSRRVQTIMKVVDREGAPRYQC